MEQTTVNPLDGTATGGQALGPPSLIENLPGIPFGNPPVLKLAERGSFLQAQKCGAQVFRISPPEAVSQSAQRRCDTRSA